MESSKAQLDKGREAFANGKWRDAYDALGAAREVVSLDPQDFWRLALSSYLIGDEDTFLRALQKGHQASLDQHDPVTAARYAFWLGLHLVNRGEIARATGWFGRVARLLESEGRDCAEKGYLILQGGHQRLSNGDYEGSVKAAAEAAAVAQRFGDDDLLALALHLEGRARIRQQRVEEGLALLDEAMVAVVTGELSPQVTGLIYCSVISACREIYDLRRVQEWTAALTGWCEDQPDMVSYTGECRVYRAEILQRRGEWREALAEACRAAECFERGPLPRAAGLAFYRQAEVHRLRGEWAAAEDAYRTASRSGREPQPGMALLRLAQGDPHSASASIRRALAETADPLRRARLLPAHIEIMLAVGDPEEARRAQSELAEVAKQYGSGVLGTLVAHAEGAIELAAGNPTAALVPLRRACREWETLGVPHEAARARMLLGLACRELGDEDGAVLELDAARAEFDRLGAVPDLRRLDVLVRSGPGSRSAGGGRAIDARGSTASEGSHGLTPRERQVLSLLATGRTNRAIAGNLSISEKTVARHVANIFGKLGVSSRAAATAFAYEHDLVSKPT